MDQIEIRLRMKREGLSPVEKMHDNQKTLGSKAQKKGERVAGDLVLTDTLFENDWGYRKRIAGAHKHFMTVCGDIM